MLKVLTNTPSKNLQNCELTYLGSEKIDITKALEQHKAYCKMIEECGAEVIILNENPQLADSVFVEDPIIVLDEVAISTSMGVESRRQESSALKKYFSKTREIKEIKLPSKIEGGDLLQIGKKLYVGISKRTNIEAINDLKDIVSQFDYEVIPVEVFGCLHLKTGCTALDDNTILINSDWVQKDIFKNYNIIEVPKEEPFGANIMRIEDFICMNASFPKTLELVKSLGYKIKSVDISEFVKAEAGLTCMSVRFN